MRRPALEGIPGMESGGAARRVRPPPPAGPAGALIAPAVLLGWLALGPGAAYGDTTSESSSSATASGIGLAESGVGIADFHGSASANATSNPSQRIDQVFEGTQAVAPSGLAPTVIAPDVFRNKTGTLPANSRGILLAMSYYEGCGATLGEHDTDEIRRKGGSGTTRVTFLPHGDYLRMLNEEPVEGAPPPRQNSVKQVSLEFPKQAVRTRCLGIVNVTAREKEAAETQFFSIMNDAQHFVKDTLRGVEHARLLCGKHAIASSVGMGSGGIGAAVSPGASDIGGSGFFASLLAGVTGNSARTFPRSQLGLTCIVASGTEGNATVDMAYLNTGGFFDSEAIRAQAQQQLRQLNRGNGNNNDNRIPEYDSGPGDAPGEAAPATTE